MQDLSQRGFDAAIRIGNGQWAGLQAQRIASGDVLPVASPDMALQWETAFENGGDVPLLEHDVSPWRAWFNTQGRSLCGRQQALFNDAGLLIRAAEQGFGIALAKTLLVQDAIAAGRLVALAAPCRLSDDDVYLVAADRRVDAGGLAVVAVAAATVGGYLTAQPSRLRGAERGRRQRPLQRRALQA